MDKLHHLHGMRDLSQESWRTLRKVQDRLTELFSLHGYQIIETPMLEPTELYLRKSGGELAARMYTFLDPGGNQVSLRPEYTASIVRHFLSEDSDDLLPVRVQYAGPVFRYEQEFSSDHQFTQVGAELLGSSSPRADAEILSLSWMGLSHLGLKGHRLEMSDLSVLHTLLDSLGLSDRAIVFIMGSISELRQGVDGLARVRERATQLRLLGEGPPQSHLGAAIGDLTEGEARELLYGLLQWAEIGSLGQREPSDVVERLLRKLRGADDPDRLRKGLEVAYELAKVRGDPASCLSEVARLIRTFGLDPGVLDRVREVIGLLHEDRTHGAVVDLDFGLARGLAYYTGIVFEITHPENGHSLGGGGRYDGLARALSSSSNVPALGFAYTLEPLVGLLEHTRDVSEDGVERPVRLMVMAADGTAYREGLRMADALRGKGTAVEMELRGLGVEEGLTYARAKGIAEVIAVDSDGNSTRYPVQPTPGGN